MTEKKLLSLRISETMLKRIDEFCEKDDISNRSQAIFRLIELGLKVDSSLNSSEKSTKDILKEIYSQSLLNEYLLRSMNSRDLALNKEVMQKGKPTDFSETEKLKNHIENYKEKTKKEADKFCK